METLPRNSGRLTSWVICLFLKDSLEREMELHLDQLGTCLELSAFPENMPKEMGVQIGSGQNQLLLERKKGESGGWVGNSDPNLVFDLKFKILSIDFLLR